MSEEDDFSPAFAGSGSALPNPYGTGFEDSIGQLEKTQNEWQKIEKVRIESGRWTSHRGFIIMRSGIGLFTWLYCVLSVIFPHQFGWSLPWTVFLFLLAYAFVLTPPIMAAESSWRAFSLRTSLWEQGGMRGGERTGLKSHQGMDRIAESLRDSRRNNGFSVLIGIVTLLMLFFSSGSSYESLAYNLGLLVAMTTSLAFMFHSIFTQDSMFRFGDDFPYLMIHAPTQHPTQPDTVMGDIIKTHLDPDTLLDWDDWEIMLRNALKPRQNYVITRERLFYILYLQHQGIISMEEALVELELSIKPDKIKEILLDQDLVFNWTKIQRIILHAKAWQPQLFQLIDRLHNDLNRGKSAILADDWRLDLAIEKSKKSQSGHLFICVNNQSKSNQRVIVDVVVPGGLPELRTQQFEIQSSKRPTAPLPVNHETKEDVLDWAPKYLQKGAFLWLPLAWDEDFGGQKVVQVILKDFEGKIIKSRTIHTAELTLSGRLFESRLEAILFARKVGNGPIPV
ncbi:MAG: hypothetical protein VYB50_02740 [Candidatus Thermoplasmatota archaeon]|nr:hypothetical protein [Candidatus Thermoplasmatota archaeon]